MKKAIYYSIVIIIIFIILINIFSSFNISLFGVRIFKVASGSMQPAIKVNDIVVVSKKSFYNKGDIITFKNDSNEYVTHRIVDIENDLYKTKGDFNNASDKPISKESIVGKVIYKSRVVTFINRLISNIIFWLVISIVGIIYLFIPKKSNNK